MKFPTKFPVSLRSVTSDFAIQVDLFWEIRLEVDESASRILCEVLDELHGVEQVTMRRYSATVTFAGHIVTTSGVRELLVDCLARPKLAHALAHRLGKGNVEVVVE